MQKIRTLDGHYVYNIKKENKAYYLADNTNYEKDIDELLDISDDIRYDSLIIIFGFDTGEYLTRLSQILCPKNKVLIFEPNSEIFDENKSKINNDNIKLVLYNKTNVRAILYGAINSENFNNLYVHAFGNYDEIYKEEYNNFIKNLDCVYYTASSSINVAHRFKEEFIKNLICNLRAINSASIFNPYENVNKGVPAIIISAGPSLDRNLAELIKYKSKIEKYFIITGSRTLDAVMKKGIKPDMVVSVDPVNDNYDMMKNYLEEDIILAFYEYSNRYLVRNYKGEKLYLPSVLSNIIPELHDARRVFTAGSVAHNCIDIAKVMGCSPIILLGQDFAFTYGKHHSDLAVIDTDKEKNYETSFSVEDIYGNEVKTNATLNMFRIKLQEYIYLCQKVSNVEFINASYGAAIDGAPHKELSEILKKYKFNNEKINFVPNRHAKIDEESVIHDILGYIDVCILKAQKGNSLCTDILSGKVNKSLVDIDDDDGDLKKFLCIMEIVNEFENSPRRFYLGGYYNEFQFEIKEKKFNMPAKEYASLTSDLKYQSECFLEYFKEMEDFLVKIREVIINTLEEFDI